MKAIEIRSHGGPEVLSLVDLPEPSLKNGEVLVAIRAAGINFIDTYQRSGLYKVPLPYVPGLEGAGTVEKLGPGAKRFKVGDHVAFSSVPGAYSERVAAPEEKLALIPNKLTFEQGAAAMLQGLTAHYLSRSTYELKKNDTCLIHAGAGGVGLILTQMAKLCGAKVISTVSSQEKAGLSRAAGADEVIIYTEEDFVERTKEITQGVGVQVVYDSVGKTTFDGSLRCLTRLGHMVTFGQSSGPVADFSILKLSEGSLTITRPRLNDYVATREEFESRCRELFGWIEKGNVTLRIEHTYPLADAAAAHRDLEGRKTTGKLVLTV